MLSHEMSEPPLPWEGIGQDLVAASTDTPSHNPEKIMHEEITLVFFGVQLLLS